MVENQKQSEKTADGKEQIKIKLNKDFSTVENAMVLLKSIIEPISSRFTKKYESFEDDKLYFM